MRDAECTCDKRREILFRLPKSDDVLFRFHFYYRYDIRTPSSREETDYVATKKTGNLFENRLCDRYFEVKIFSLIGASFNPIGYDVIGAKFKLVDIHIYKIVIYRRLQKKTKLVGELLYRKKNMDLLIIKVMNTPELVFKYLKRPKYLRSVDKPHPIERSSFR